MPEWAWELPNGWKREGVQGAREYEANHDIWVYSGMVMK